LQETNDGPRPIGHRAQRQPPCRAFGVGEEAFDGAGAVAFVFRLVLMYTT
jgi:hypothetical protein